MMKSSISKLFQNINSLVVATDEELEIADECVRLFKKTI